MSEERQTAQRRGGKLKAGEGESQYNETEHETQMKWKVTYREEGGGESAAREEVMQGRCRLQHFTSCPWRQRGYGKLIEPLPYDVRSFIRSITEAEVWSFTLI